MWPMRCILVDGGMIQSSVCIKIIDDYKHIRLLVPMEQITGLITSRNLTVPCDYSRSSRDLSIIIFISLWTPFIVILLHIFCDRSVEYLHLF